MKKVFLGLGSNIGDREKNITEGIAHLRQNPFIWIQKISHIIETEAFTKVPQPKFLNAALQAETILTPDELLEFTQSVEKKLGRTHKGQQQPRTLDIDLLFYGNDIICSENLTIPHPLLHERAFVLIPLFELSPELKHPLLGETITTLYKQIVGY